MPKLEVAYYNLPLKTGQTSSILTFRPTVIT